MTCCGEPDGERRLAHEVLQRRAVAVDRRVVEVGPELADGVLAVLAHEHLAAEADDGLVGAAVPVVLEPATVERDHLLRVRRGPEDVVGEEAVAVVGGLLGDLGAADRAVPDERGDAVERPRRRGEALQRRAEPPLPVDDLLAPQPVQQRVVLDGERDALADVLAEPRVDRAGVAAAHHEVVAAVREVLQRGVVLGDAHRVGRRDERGRGRQDDAARSGRRCRRGWSSAPTARTAGCGAPPSRRRRGPTSSAFLRDGDGGLDPLVLGGGTPGGGVHGDVADGEDAELHAYSLLGG